MAFMSHDGVGSKATTDRDSVEGMAQGPIGEIRANAVEPSGGDVRDGEEQSFASRSGGAIGGGRRILPRGNDTLVETLRTADSNRLRVLGISEEQWIERCHLNGLPQRRRSFDLLNRPRISLLLKPYGSQNLAAVFDRPLKTPLPHKDPLCLPLVPLWECSAL